MVKISELKMKQIRKEIPFTDDNGDKQIIKIYNVTPETKEALIKMVEDATDEDGLTVIEGADMLRDLFPLFTDLEIDLDFIDDVVNNPTKEIVLINSEILSIVNEVSMEILLNQSLEYEKLLLASEQIKGMNMVEYIKERMSRMVPLRDYDPLNAEAMTERNMKEIEELRRPYETVKDIYEKEKSIEKKEVEAKEIEQEKVSKPKPKAKPKAKAKPKVVATEDKQ